MSVFYAQIIVNGLALSMTYILLALGLTLVLSIMDVLNMAHGAIYMLSGYVFYTFVTIAGLPYFLAAGLAIAVIGFLGILLERYILRPVGTAHLEALVMTWGLAIALESIVVVIFGGWTLPVKAILQGTIKVYGVTLSLERLAIILVGALLVGALFYYVGMTKQGRAMRAVSQNRIAAQMYGIDPNQVSRSVFFIACALAAAGGILTGPIFGLTPYMGLAPLFNGFNAMILGGLGSIMGCVVGGLVLGFIISFGTTLLDSSMANIIAFALILLILVFRPRGILGHVQK